MQGICMEFYFKLDDEEYNFILFAQKNRIIQFDTNSGNIEVLYDFNYPLKTQPNFFKINDD